jgi:hypothetical protein
LTGSFFYLFFPLQPHRVQNQPMSHRIDKTKYFGILILRSTGIARDYTLVMEILVRRFLVA